MAQGGIPDQITSFLTTLAGQSTQNLVARKQQEAQRASELATQLAGSGQLQNLPPELQKSFQKTLGNDIFESLSFQSNLAQQRQAPVEALRGGAVAQLQAPVTEQTGVEEGPQPVTAEGAPAEGPGQGQAIFGQRAPTEQEQFERLAEVGPAGAALVGGPQLGQLVAQQAQLGAGAAARSAKERRLGTELVADLAKQGRQVLQPIPVSAFDPDQIPQGFFPVTIGDTIFMVQSKVPNLRVSGRNAIRLVELGVTDPRNLTPEQAEQLNDEILKDEVDVAAATGQNAARIKRDSFRANPLIMNLPNHGFFDTTTGERISDFANTGEAEQAQKGGGLVNLTGPQRDQLGQLKKSKVTFNLIMDHMKAIYGPGGILENLDASGRLDKGVKGFLGRAFQTEPELTRAKRTLDGLVVRIGRELQGAKGPQSDLDIKKLENVLPKLGGLPDTQEVALGLLEDMRKSISGAGGAILGNDKFVLPGLSTFDGAQPRIVGSDEVLSQPLNATPTQIEALVKDLGGEKATQVRAFFENNPEMKFQEAQQIVQMMLLPPELQQAVMTGQMTLEQAQQQQPQQGQ